MTGGYNVILTSLAYDGADVIATRGPGKTNTCLGLEITFDQSIENFENWVYSLHARIASEL